MAKTKLKRATRDVLIEHAEIKVNAGLKPIDDKIEVVKKELYALAKAEWNKQFPQAERKVLKKFGLLEESDDLPFVGGGEISGVGSFQVPHDGYGECEEWGLKLTDGHPIVKKASEFDSLIEERRTTYKAECRALEYLINNAIYFEDVVTVWKEAETLRKSVCVTGTAIAVVLSDEQRLAIRQGESRRAETSNG